MKRFFAGIVTIALFAVVLVPSVGAATIAELQAMIAQLQAQIAALSGGSSSTGGYMFNTDLTVGSTGADVTELQKILVSKGHLVMPAGASYGYFGTLTRAALAKWQAAEGISPAAGYFGPISRARVNATGGTTGGTTTGGAGISTPGVEGTLTVTLNPIPGSGTKVYEGDSKAAVLGIKLEAKTSDIRVERVKVQLPNTAFYNKIASKIYVADNGNVLGSMDLNSSTVVKEGSNYFITVAGLNYVVPKDATKVLTVHIDVRPSIDTTDLASNYTLTIPVDGVRGIDGAGVNQYGPTATAFSRSIDPEGDLADSAALKVSLNTNTPETNEAVASESSSEDELDGLSLLAFDVKAEKDAVMVTDLVANITRGGNTSTATSSTAYLYDGSTLIGSASVVSTSATAMTATFSDIDFVVSKDSTKTLTLKVDIRDAGAAATTFSASIAAANVTAENTAGDTVTPTGSATGETMTIRNVGPMFTLVSKTVEKSATAQQSNTSTSTMKGIFTVKVKAVGGDILFGTQATTSEANRMFKFGVYRGSSLATLNAASTSSFTVPAGVVESTNSFTLQENNEVTLAVEYLVEGRDVTSALVSTNTYSIGIEEIRWMNGSLQTSSFMGGETSWRTSGVSLP